VTLRIIGPAAIVVIVFWQSVGTANAATMQTGARRGTSAKPSSTRIVRHMQEEQNRLQENLAEVTGELNQVSLERLGDIVSVAPPGKITDAVQKIKAFIDLVKVGQNVPTYMREQKYWLALSEALSGAVTVADVLVPPNSPYRAPVEALSKGVALIEIVEHKVDERQLRELQAQLQLSNDKLSRAITAIKQHEESDSGLSLNQTNKPRAVDAQSFNTLVNNLTHKIENVTRDPGPIYLEYESGGFRTETPPAGLTSAELERWLKEHHDFLRIVRERRVTTGSQPESDIPQALLDKGRDVELTKWIANHADFLQRVLNNNLPPEARTNPIEVSDQQGSDLSQVPRGWVECQCPSDHPNLGIFITDKQGRTRQFHDPSFHCP
jgi:hypothetical protein